MEPVSLLTIGLPKMLQKIVSDSFIKIRSVNLISHFASIGDFLRQSEQVEPSVILVESNHTSVCLELLYLYPRARVVMIKRSGKSFVIWKMIPIKKILDDVSSDELVNAIIFMD